MTRYAGFAWSVSPRAVSKTWGRLLAYRVLLQTLHRVVPSELVAASSGGNLEERNLSTTMRRPKSW